MKILFIGFLIFLGMSGCESPNNLPFPIIVANPEQGPAPLTVRFSGFQSYDPDYLDSIIEYTWEIGGVSDPVVYNEACPVHIFTSPGNYKVKLTVKDSHGTTDSSSITIHVYDPFEPSEDGRIWLPD